MGLILIFEGLQISNCRHWAWIAMEGFGKISGEAFVAAEGVFDKLVGGEYDSTEKLESGRVCALERLKRMR